MGYEIEFFPVGEGSQSGDAILVRYGDLFASPPIQKVIVIDGGFTSTGVKMVEHIRNVFHTDTVDLVISTHPDQDHINGLDEILKNLNVKELWMHKPWEHSHLIKDTFTDGRITDNSLRDKYRKNVGEVAELEKIASSKNIQIREPFAGTYYDNGVIKVLGPDMQYYINDLLPNFIQGYSTGVFATMKKAVSGVISWITETWTDEKLMDPNEIEVGPINNSSTILLFELEGFKLLLTSDAGSNALHRAVDFSEKSFINISNLDIVQVPHHGSRRNVGPTILNRLLGEKMSSENDTKRGFAIVSCVEGNSKHPSRKVTNSYIRRGYPVYPTKGKNLNYTLNAPSRTGKPATPIPFHYEVEE